VPDASAFNEYYYRNCCGQPYERSAAWLTFFGTIADRIVADISPRRVLDAGCAIGMLVEALRARGVDARGVDLSSFAIESVPDTLKPLRARRVDFRALR
jgi:2-polyprenyl-3-methyl-5-hydroxy-6-metoxy-1,4-benzoquinol methylase